MSEHQGVSPSPDEVRSELERILASEAFANSGRLARLLRFVVERTLAGEGDQLKEYVLGVEVFDRGEQYDPRLDSIVRVEARRLRSKLDDYYQNGGAADAVAIAIPRGTYVPVFTRREAVSAPGSKNAQARLQHGALLVLAIVTAAAVIAVAWLALRASVAAEPKVSLAVLPFEHHSGAVEEERLAARLSDTITSEIARVGSVAVVSRTSARQFEGTRTPLRVIAQTLGVQFVLEATVETEGEQLRVTARLVDAATDRKVWADIFEGTSDDVPALSQTVAAAVARALQERQRP